MDYKLEKIEDIQYGLSVELSKQDLETYITAAKKELSAALKTDGFRQGKVPAPLADKYIDKAQVLEIALENALHTSFSKISKEKGLDIISTSDLKIDENTPDKVKYSIKLLMYPEITISDLDSIKIKKDPVTLSAAELEMTVENLRASRAKLLPKDGPAQAGDRVEVNFEVMSDGKLIQGGVSENHPVVIGKGNFIPGFETELVGMKNGGEKQFSLVAPKDYYEKNIAGKKLDFKVKVNLVQKVELPELGDDFAKSVGKFKDLAALKSSIKDGLHLEKERKQDQRIQSEILEAVIKNSEIKAPKLLTEQQLDGMVADFDAHLHSQGMELGLYLAHIKKTQEELRKDWKADAERQVNMSLALHKVAKDNKIEASAGEVEQEMSNIVSSLAIRGKVDETKIDTERLRERASEQIINSKALAFLEKKCVIVS